jgi:hypothetical protein
MRDLALRPCVNGSDRVLLGLTFGGKDDYRQEEDEKSARCQEKRGEEERERGSGMREDKREKTHCSLEGTPTLPPHRKRQ